MHASMERPFKCSICGKRFRVKSRLTAHVFTHERAHTEEKPFQCRWCVQRFNRKMNRTAHERTHTGEERAYYACSNCGKCFITTPSGQQGLDRKKLLMFQQTVLGDQSKGQDQGNFTIISSNGERIPCHQLFLQESSPVFEAMFQPHTAESQTRETTIEDVSSKTIRQLLFFFYTDALPQDLEENMEEMLYAATKYQLELLREACESALAKTLSPETAVERLQLGVRFHLPALKLAAARALLDEWDRVPLESQKQLRHNEEAFLFYSEIASIDRAVYFSS